MPRAGLRALLPLHWTWTGEQEVTSHYIVGGLEKSTKSKVCHFHVLMGLSCIRPGGAIDGDHFFVAYPKMRGIPV